MNKWIIFLMLALMLIGCSSPQVASPASPAGVEGAASSGPTGLSRVEVSDGVRLVTPGVEVAGSLVEAGSAPVGFVTATPTATVDPVSVVMPEGIPLYPGAMNLKVPTAEELSIMADATGMSGNYVIFYTTDSNDQVVEYYSEIIAAAGWSVVDAQTEPDYDGTITQMWSKDRTILLLQTWPPADGLMKVQITWM